MAATSCATCGAAGAGQTRICDNCLRARVAESCRAQGVPETVDDPKVLDRVARLLDTRRGAA